MNMEIDSAPVIKKIREALNAIDQLKAENPGVDVDAILTAKDPLYPTLIRLSNSELDKFIAYAKEQGTAMPFDSMEMGILAAGRRDMQNGLAEILDSLKFEKPICPECDDGMKDKGRGKKKL